MDSYPEYWFYSGRLRNQDNPGIKYQALRERQIRLIEFKLFLDRPDPVPRLYFRTRYLYLESLPRYIPSYRWSTPQTKVAPPKYNGYWIVQNHPLSAVYGFMREQQNAGENESFFFWIDQYSIDQKNLDEKDRQVPYMKEIYKRAWKTLIFIGNPPDQFLEKTFRGAFNLLKDFYLAAQDPKTGPEEAKMSLVQSETISTMSALAAILTAPWFSRTWVLQEAVVLQDAVLVCGLSRIRWKKFLDQVRSFDRGSKHAGESSVPYKITWEDFMRSNPLQ